MLKNKLIENVFSLLTLKGAEYVVQFITLPYLLRVLGPDKYGAIIFAQAIINYGILFVDYGFNITAPRDIARTKKSELGQQFSAIFLAKLCLFICILLTCIVFLSTIGFDDILLLICVFPSLLGNVIFPIWFFQGIQQMRFITIFNLIARSVSVIGIFSFVNHPNDYYLAAIFQSSVPVLAGVISLHTIYVKYPMVFVKPKLEDVRKKIYDGWDIFISTLFINLYTNTNVFLLGLLTDTTVVGYYSAASKLIDAVKGVMMPVSNAVFPHVSLLFKESKKKAISFLCKILHYTIVTTFILSLMVFLFSEQFVSVIMGISYGESIKVLRIISFLPFIVGMSNIFGIQTMVAFGMQRMFSRILMFSALLNFVLVCPMIYMWQGVGLAITVVIVESFVTITMYMALRKNNIVLQ